MYGKCYVTKEEAFKKLAEHINDIFVDIFVDRIQDGELVKTNKDTIESCIRKIYDNKIVDNEELMVIMHSVEIFITSNVFTSKKDKSDIFDSFDFSVNDNGIVFYHIDEDNIITPIAIFKIGELVSMAITVISRMKTVTI